MPLDHAVEPPLACLTAAWAGDGEYSTLASQAAQARDEKVAEALGIADIVAPKTSSTTVNSRLRSTTPQVSSTNMLDPCREPWFTGLSGACICMMPTQPQVAEAWTR